MAQSPVKVRADDQVYFLCLVCGKEGRPKWPATVESFLAQVERFSAGHQHRGKSR